MQIYTIVIDFLLILLKLWNYILQKILILKEYSAFCNTKVLPPTVFNLSIFCVCVLSDRFKTSIPFLNQFFFICFHLTEHRKFSINLSFFSALVNIDVGEFESKNFKILCRKVCCSCTIVTILYSQSCSCCAEMLNNAMPPCSFLIFCRSFV